MRIDGGNPRPLQFPLYNNVRYIQKHVVYLKDRTNRLLTYNIRKSISTKPVRIYCSSISIIRIWYNYKVSRTIRSHHTSSCSADCAIASGGKSIIAHGKRVGITSSLAPFYGAIARLHFDTDSVV